MKNISPFAIKLVLSAGLLIYLLRSVDLHAVLRHLAEGDHPLFAVAVVVYAVVVVLSTVRWKVLLDALGGSANLRALVDSYLVSAFFANFLPSNIGGDVVRARETARAAGSHTASLTVAAMDRVVGFVALYVIAASAFLLGGPQVRGLTGARVILLALTVGFMVSGALFVRPGLVAALIERLGLRRLPWLFDRVASVQSTLAAFRANPRAMRDSFLLSMALQFLGVSYFFVVARALRIPLDPGTCLLMVPLCTLIQALPISFNGWGVREGVYVVYFRQVGLPKESALAFSIVAAALAVLLSVSGLVVWLARRSESQGNGRPGSPID